MTFCLEYPEIIPNQVSTVGDFQIRGIIPAGFIGKQVTLCSIWQRADGNEVWQEMATAQYQALCGWLQYAEDNR